MPTSLADVARISGVSTATVSHVINGTRYVSPETVEKVRNAIASTGYRPNPYARALRTATSESIGFVASDVSNSYSTAVMRGIASALRTRGYTLLVADADENPTLEHEAIDALVERKVDGLIVAPTTSTDPVSFEQIEQIGVPVVLVDRAVPLDADGGLEGEFMVFHGAFLDDPKVMTGGAMPSSQRNSAALLSQSHFRSRSRPSFRP